MYIPKGGNVESISRMELARQITNHSHSPHYQRVQQRPTMVHQSESGPSFCFVSMIL